MTETAKLEQAVLGLPASERARLALVAWNSLNDAPELAGDPSFDPEGLALAAARDQEIESGAVAALSHEEFVARTRAAR